MEIFQTIWTALTTENELLSKFIIIPITFFEIYLGMLLFTTLLNINATTKNKTKYVIIVSSTVTLFDIIIPNPYRSFINLAVIFTLPVAVVFRYTLL